MADIDPKRAFLEMQKEHEFRLNDLMEINNLKNYRLGKIRQAAFAGKKYRHVHSVIERAV